MIAFFSIVCAPGIFIAAIGVMTPKILFKLYLCWYALLVFLFYAYTIQMPYEPNDRFGITDILFSYNFITSGVIVVLRTIFILMFSDNENQDCLFIDIIDLIADTLQKEKQDILIAFEYFTAIVYGFVAVYYLYLFHGDIFVGYQPLWIIYFILSISIVSLIYFVTFSKFAKQSTKFKVYRKYLQFFSYGLCGVIFSLLVFCLSISFLVVKETNLVIKQHEASALKENLEYCIQIPAKEGGRKYQTIDTLLDLSPLTMQSKAPFGSINGWGNSYFHGILVVKKQDITSLYNWSYKQKKWTYLEPGFAKVASIDEPTIECNPRSGYLQHLPWIFP